MGIFDKAKDALSGQGEQVDKGQDMAKDRLGEMTGDQPEQPA
jgi:uncharacterized membrane protein YjdF